MNVPAVWPCDECGALVAQDQPGDQLLGDRFIRRHTEWHEKSRPNWHPFEGCGCHETCVFCGHVEKGHDEQFQFPYYQQRRDASWKREKA